jgi:hypothetical protein
MIKAAVKLAFVALLANASWQLLNVYWPHFKFTDAVKSTTQYRGEKSDDQVRQRILELAVQYDVPVTDENLTLRRDEAHTIVDAAYVRAITFMPGVTYPWPFTLHVDTFVVKPLTAQ